MATDATWDFQNPASKTRLLGVLGAEIDAMFELAAEPAHWHTPTACPGLEDPRHGRTPHRRDREFT